MANSDDYISKAYAKDEFDIANHVRWKDIDYIYENHKSLATASK